MSRDALIVGINAYQHLPELQAPARDADSVARCLEGFGECRVVRLPEAIIDQKPAINQRGLVTTALLEAALIKLFKPAGKTIPQTAIFYYSGHGLQRQAGIQEGYLATSDANPGAGQYGLSLHWLRRLLQESPVQQQVIVLDCCHGGEFFNLLEADPGARSGIDRLFMVAAREYEAAYESLSGDHSVFTQALLSGLNPYKIKGGIVTGHYLTDVVNRQLKGEIQQPLFESSGSEIVLTRVSGLITQAQDAPPTLLDRLHKLRYGFCPFPGAAAFESARSEFFFGRDDVIHTLVQRVQSSRLCVLTGASGVGKTSLLQAGLMPRLTSPHPETTWDVRYSALSTAPVTRIAEVFVEAQATGLQRAEQLRRAESFLQQGAEGFCQLVQALVSERGPSYRLVLVLDQFEELLTPDLASERDRRLVIACLIAAIEQEHLPLHLVLGLRSHHLVDLADVPKLQALVMAHSLPVPTMTYNQLKATIVGPLEKLGLGYDANLVYTLLLDVVSAPADLALLQKVLKDLWLRREIPATESAPPRLTLATYVEMGGLRQLLNQQATSIYQGLSQTEQAIARRIFLSFCDLGDSPVPTRRSVTLSELVTPTRSQRVVLATLDKLLAARLVVAQPVCPGPRDLAAIAVPGWSPLPWGTDQTLPELPRSPTLGPDYRPEPSSGSPCFDIAHEALIRNWPLLQQWLHSDGALVRQQRTIEVAAQAWQQQQQPHHPDYFLTKTRLDEAKLLRQAHGDQLSVLAHDYIDECDRYARNCCRKRHLVRLLIPLSMATGMLTAYGHSYMTQPESQLVLAKSPRSPTSDVAPAFTLTEPAPIQEPGADLGRPAFGSPQVGTVGTPRLPLPSPTAQSVGQTAPMQSVRAVGQGRPAAGKGAAQPAIGASSPANLPPANQMVKLQAWWISPDNPAVVIQIWCTSGTLAPVCFTSTAARED
ncbi:caspase family protein [Leptolyngbya sp. KIOST-1]|uniref:nSTAND1 domain-containing NTPase n=1 Tax=Leptolyngbya sp. KIOST-1 TaxID=1229172 RepID=UPI000907CDCA|nr:caspase family protein [Leptolyngbya sp. KIOST-1]